MGMTVSAPTNAALVRDERWDAMRGVAILCVVAIHAIGVVYFARDIGGATTGIILRQIVAFAVPLFLCISGYWARTVTIGSLSQYVRFLNKRIPRVLVPYVVWSFVCLAITPERATLLSLRAIVYTLLVGGASAPYYFIPLICQFYLLLPVFLALKDKWFGLPLVAFANAACLIVVYFVQLRLQRDLPFVDRALPFYMWMVYFLIGMQYDQLAPRLRLPTIMALTGVALMVALAESFVLLRVTGNHEFATSTLRLGSLLYSGCAVLTVLRLGEVVTRFPLLLVKLGQCSLGIYFVHIIFLSAIAHVAGKAHFLTSWQPIFLVLGVLGATGASYGTVTLARMVMSPKVARNVLGFGL